MPTSARKALAIALLLLLQLPAEGQAVDAAPTPQPPPPAVAAPAGPEAPEPIPDLQELQSWRPALRGRVEHPEPALRERALRETGLQVGSQAALAQRSREQNAEVEKYAKWLEEIYRFDQLLIERGLVLPPVIIETRRYAKTDRVRLSKIEQSYQIVEPAQVVSAPPSWRDYLIAPPYPAPVKPEGALLPQNAEEERWWAEVVGAGWKQGEEQAWLAFKARVGELHRAFLGRVRYLVLLERGIVTAPAVRVSRRGIKVDGDELLIGRTDAVLSRLPRFTRPKGKRGRVPWQAIPEVLTTYDDGSPVE